MKLKLGRSPISGKYYFLPTGNVPQILKNKYWKEPYQAIDTAKKLGIPENDISIVEGTDVLKRTMSLVEKYLGEGKSDPRDSFPKIKGWEIEKDDIVDGDLTYTMVLDDDEGDYAHVNFDPYAIQDMIMKKPTNVTVMYSRQKRSVSTEMQIRGGFSRIKNLLDKAFTWLVGKRL